jgi:hypothetical protein
MTVLISLVALVLALACVVAVAARRGNRSWTDEEYEKERKGGSVWGNAFLATQGLWEPGAQKALEQRTTEETYSIESGAPPDPNLP